MDVTKILNFCCSHSVMDAYTCKCDRLRGGALHGHNYVVEITIGGPIAKDGMVIDFSLLKEKFNYLIDAFDHTLVINHNDLVLVQLGPYLSSRYIIFPENATAEYMAQYFFNYIKESLHRIFPDIDCKSVVVWETPTSKATCTHAQWHDESLGLVPKLSISPAIYKNWGASECYTFEGNNGWLLDETDLITSLSIQTSGDGILQFTART